MFALAEVALIDLALTAADTNNWRIQARPRIVSGSAAAAFLAFEY